MRIFELVKHISGHSFGILVEEDDDEIEKLYHDWLGDSSIPLIQGRTALLADAENWDAVVIDQRETPRTYRELLETSPLFTIAVEEGSGFRRYADFLIDTKAGQEERKKSELRKKGSEKTWIWTSNRIASPLPAAVRHRREYPKSAEDCSGKPAIGTRILISFGGDDPAGLTEKTARALHDRGIDMQRQVTIATGARYSGEIPAGYFEHLDSPTSLRELIAGYDLVITSYGLTAYEAVEAGVPVVLVEPSEYHHRLAEAAGFLELGVGSPDIGRLTGFLEEPEYLEENRRWVQERVGVPMAAVLEEILSNIGKGRENRCPVCNTTSSPSLYRYEDRTFRRCCSCGVIFLQNHKDNSLKYTGSYFFEEYRAQYGRTYLEDFGHIKAMAGKRLDIIDSLIPSSGRGKKRTSLFDIGCAYGAFLSAASERNYQAYGLDLSEEAVQYCRNTLHISAVSGSVHSFDPEESFGIDQFEVISLWFVIEHLDNIEQTVQALSAMQPPGGILAFSTPNGKGISARRNPESFFQSSPFDHRVVLNPKTLRDIVEQNGYRLRRIRVTGIHPERFYYSSGKQSARNLFRRVERLFIPLIARIFRLGDTFELYAVRNK
ncbi:MAG: methyltransferase domain-containing protein [Spirochaetales bacterium]|nr:methyltransferase domain-containing protein [Spirochaetales bacterium]